MRRFYCSKQNITADTVYFDKAESAHISRVLRLEKGCEIIVSAGDGVDRFCTLTAVGDECTAQITRTENNLNEPHSELVLFQAVIKNEKMDLLIQKATELGVTRIVPVICERTVVKIENRQKEEKKQARWEKIALEACKQCGRSRVPEVLPAVEFNEAAELFKKYSLKLVAYENERTKSITEAVHKAESVAYFIGPEGGITDDEHSALVAAGAVSVSLGKRILRAETAAISATAVILALMGEMDV